MLDNIKGIDRILSLAVLIQSPLVMFQNILISVFHMPVELTTTYRVILTAIPLSIALCFAFYRRWLIFVIVYAAFFLIFVYNVVAFPYNEPFLLQGAIRFLLPVVIPSGLCLMCVSNIRIVEETLYQVSWITFFLAVYYMINYFRGAFIIETYSMNISYGLLLPMFSLYSAKNKYSMIAAFLLFIMTLAIGSRGAAIVFVLYLSIDSFFSYRKYFVLITTLASSVVFLLPLFLEFLRGFGFQSRTLSLLLEGNIDQTSSRDYIYEQMQQVFWESPFKGIGLFGDRFYLGGYCHNIILELYLNWGCIVASLLILSYLYNAIFIYVRSDSDNRKILVKYTIICLGPLMVSSSYLTNYNFGIYIGILCLLNFEMQDRRRMFFE